MAELVRALGLFVVTAFAELLGSYLMFLWVRQGKSVWLAVPSIISLVLFGWLLTLHPGAAARTYAAYGGIYVVSSLFWLWWVEGQSPTRWDMVGGIVILIGAIIIIVKGQTAP
jgi:small multidrug resistance family-3 protein